MSYQEVTLVVQIVLVKLHVATKKVYAKLTKFGDFTFYLFCEVILYPVSPLVRHLSYFIFLSTVFFVLDVG